MKEIQIRPKKLRDKAMDRIFPPHHRQFLCVGMPTCERTYALNAWKEDDQILRTEIVTGGEPGGPCISDTQTGDEVIKGKATEICGNACAIASVV
jgi:hypothetical protein